MRPRTFEELNSRERLDRLSRELSPHHTPKVIRNYIRNHYVVELIDWLFDVAKGVEMFDQIVGDKIISAPAPPSVRHQAAKLIMETATVGANVHHLGDDNESVQGAIALPELDMRNAQRRIHGAAQASPAAGMKALSGQTFSPESMERTFGGREIVVDEYTMPVTPPENGHTNGHANGGNGSE